MTSPPSRGSEPRAQRQCRWSGSSPREMEMRTTLPRTLDESVLSRFSRRIHRRSVPCRHVARSLRRGVPAVAGGRRCRLRVTGRSPCAPPPSVASPTCPRAGRWRGSHTARSSYREDRAPRRRLSWQPARAAVVTASHGEHGPAVLAMLLRRRRRMPARVDGPRGTLHARPRAAPRAYRRPAIERRSAPALRAVGAGFPPLQRWYDARVPWGLASSPRLRRTGTPAHHWIAEHVIVPP